MAITNYSELQAAIENTTSGWMFQEALGGRTTDFISLCEAEMNSRLALKPVRPMLGRSTATVSGEFLETPTDLLAPKVFEITSISGQPEWTVKYIDPEEMGDIRWSQERRRSELEELIGAKPPEYFTLVGTELRFFPTPQASFTGELTYYKRIPALSDTNTTNWLLTAHPNAYLWGSISAAATFTRDKELLDTMGGLFETAMEGVLSSYPKPSSKSVGRMDDMPVLRRTIWQ